MLQIIRLGPGQEDLVTKLFDQYRVFYKQPSDLILARSFLRERLDHNQSVLFLCQESDTREPLGFTQLYPVFSSMRVSKNWILNDLYVVSEQRGKGIGRRLIGTALDFARQDGASWVQLSTATDNVTAQGLYEAVGFKRLQPDPAFYDYRIPVNPIC
ncbi:GNAT family N-acetyltransferase [Niabella terrae]